MEDVRLELTGIYRKYLNKEPNNFHVDALEDIIKNFACGENRLTIMAPPGSGKSSMILVLAKYLSKKNGKDILILTSHKPIRLQFEKLLEEINSRDTSQKEFKTDNIKVLTVHEWLNDQADERLSKNYEYIIADGFQDYDVKKCRAVFELLGAKTLTFSSWYEDLKTKSPILCRACPIKHVKKKKNLIDRIIQSIHSFFGNESTEEASFEHKSTDTVSFGHELDESVSFDGVIPVIKLNNMLSINNAEIQNSNVDELASVKKQLEQFRYAFEREKEEKEKLMNELEKTRYEKQKVDLLIRDIEEKSKLVMDLGNYQLMCSSLTHSLEEINNKMQSMHERIETIEHVTVKTNNNVDQINQEVKDIRREMKKVISILGPLQDEVSKQLANRNEEEREKIYHSFSDDLMKSIVNTIELEKDVRYNTEKDNLIAIFGLNNWSKLSPQSSQYLITSRIVFDNMRSYEHQIDFSPACIPITKAFENELFIHLFHKFKVFCKEKRIPSRDWPDGLTHYNAKNKTYYELFDDKFTLGSTAFIIGGKTDGSRPTSAVTGRSIFLRYCKETLFRNDLDLDDSALNQYLDNFESDIETITRKYRNQAAHRDGIKLNDAEACYNYIISVTKVMVNFIEKVN